MTADQVINRLGSNNLADNSPSPSFLNRPRSNDLADNSPSPSFLNRPRSNDLVQKNRFPQFSTSLTPTSSLLQSTKSQAEERSSQSKVL
ncbi:hypothetical protein PCASD_25950 [Puccinia coronata f. sp. avenae]|uniref:Uncharacterized protein n=1 Tax=Puccinia coronata f. sp. avenae TaxID=200324 RepID=A0A2N5RW59_9BASI|nr:hypothetical protein PCASD_25950 [Puccinia coronata f. sp. avenae]